MNIIIKILKFMGRTIKRYYPPFFLSLFIFLTIATVMQDYGQLGAKENMDIVLQLIGFTIVLATLLLTANSSAFPRAEETVTKIGCLFIIAGVLMIFGLGMAAFGLPHKEELLGKTLFNSGSAVYAFAIFTVCYGIAEMGIQATKRLFSKQQKEVA